MTETKNLDIEAIQRKIKTESAFVERLEAEVGRVIVGQRTMVQRLLIGCWPMATCSWRVSRGWPRR